MDILTKEPVPSDSEDEDYVPPPEPDRSVPRIRKNRPAALHLDDDDDDDDNDDDDDDDDDYEYQPDQQALLADRQTLVGTTSLGAASSSAGAASSSAGAASSSAGAASSSAGAASSSAGAASSSAGAASSSAGAASSSAGAAPSSAGAASSSAGAASSSAGAASNSAAPASAPAAQPTGNSKPPAVIASAPQPSPSNDEEHAQEPRNADSGKAPPVLATASSNPSESKAANTSESHDLLKQTNDAAHPQPANQPTLNKRQAPQKDLITDTANTHDQLPSPGKSSEPALKKPRASHHNQTIDDIWAEMNRTPTSNKPSTTASTSAPDQSGLQKWLNQPAKPPSSTFQIRRLEDLEKDQVETTNSNTPRVPEQELSGLHAVLNLVRGKKSATVLDGTRQKWTEFKKDEQIREELETYKKGKNRYTDRMEFLARSDVREWQYEQRGKRKRR